MTDGIEIPGFRPFEYECQWQDLHACVTWASDSTAGGQEPPPGLPIQVTQRCALCWRERTITRGETQ